MKRLTQPLTQGIISVLPIIYVSWSDSVLSPSEITHIKEKINGLEHLTDSDRDYLNQWLNPLNPPTLDVFKYWTKQIRTAAENLDLKTKKSVVELSLDIATKSTHHKNESFHNIPSAKTALLEIHDALGLTEDSTTLLLKRLYPDEIIDTEYQAKFDISEMKKILDGDQMLIRDRVRKLLRDPLFTIYEDRDKEVYRQKILDQVKEICKQGLSAYSFPKKYGGFEKNGEHIAIFEMFGYGNLSLAIKFGVQIGLFGGAVYQLGTTKHHDKYLRALHTGELMGCFAMTETGHGSNVKDIETTATYNHNDKSITVHSPNFAAGKEYIGNAMHSTMAAVFCQLVIGDQNHGVHTVLVPLRNDKHELLPGVKIEDCGYKLGLNGVDNGRIWFDKVKVPIDNLLNRYGDINEAGEYTSPIANPSKRFFTTLGALVVGRICVGMLGNNASKVALTIALRYAYKRRQFSAKGEKRETLIIDYPTHQKRLFPRLAKAYAYHFALQDLADQYSNAKEEDFRRIETLAAGLKAKATWHATDTIQTCREACGGKGYLAENRFANLKADTDIFTTFEGDNTVLMQLVSKGALTDYKQSFHDDGYRAVLKFLLTKAKHEAYEYNVLFTRNTDANHLLDHKFHFHAFNYRERKIIISLSERMQKYLKRGNDSHQAFLKVQNHMMDLAHAFIDRVVLNSFYNQIEKCADGTTKDTLLKLAQLYALENINAGKGWFLEAEYLNGTKTKAIRRIITKLYQDIKPNALGLVEAFAIPDELLAAPIAFKEWS